MSLSIFRVCEKNLSDKKNPSFLSLPLSHPSLSLGVERFISFLLISFWWNRHHISLTNTEVACKALLLLDEVTLNTYTFLRSVFVQRVFKTRTFLPFSFLFWESLHVCLPRDNVSREILSCKSQRKTLRNFISGWSSFSVFYFGVIVEFGVFGGTLAAGVTSLAPPPHPSFHNYTFWTSVSIAL